MYQCVDSIRKIFLRLPEPFLLGLARLAGFILYGIGRRRRLAFKNIKSAFPAKSAGEICSIVRRNFYLFALSFIESLIIPRTFPYVSLRGSERLGKDGGILVSIHAGSWEVSNCFLAQRFRYAIMAESQSNTNLDRVLNEMRKHQHLRVCFSLRELLRAVADNFFIGMTIDHGLEEDALPVPFFGHLVPTPRGAVYLARKFNKKIYPCYSYRQSRFSFVIEIGEPITAGGRTDEELLCLLNKLYEGYLLRNPWEYHWCYKRLKYKRNRDVIILSDAKTGHLKQSKALVSFLKESAYQIRVQEITVNYKHRILRAIADVFAFLSSRHNLTAGYMLSLILDRASAVAVLGCSADVVISTGSQIAPINKLLASFLGAKSAIILRANVPLRQFDLVVIPEHDRVFADNVVAIKGALFYPERFSEKAQACRSFFKLSQERKIAVFIGGPVQEPEEFTENLKAFLTRVRAYAQKEKYKLIISTSRRTPSDAADFICAFFKDFANAEAIVIANRTNYEFVFDGFTACADIIFVSSESISMVSEAASSGKPCVCVFFEAEDDKRKLYFESVKDEVAFLRSPFDMRGINLKASTVFEENRARLQGRIGTLL